ncbi:DUF1415 domain-containing protein [Ideonella livida]|uniref:DUF1415 domain-containing protein n=1 Tax=Ideonella livida TaxID=2707176 RepID=A0A7C9PGY0_9BURK|nr:DUF1415 domain-containing protein [Ideonella livida]NDY91633.1 DUF1415 domain-containing protein [Ideonella livida]
MTAELDPEFVVARTRLWLERAVIGLNLCPFAKSVHVKRQVRYVVSSARSPAELLAQLEQELRHLAQVDPAETDTTLLIHPGVLEDFLDFNDFLAEAEETVERLDLAGELQVASFHPEFQFGDARADDPSNLTNRSPWPTLHLIREASIDRAVEAFPEAETIYERNIELTTALGHAGWQSLFADADALARTQAAGGQAREPQEAPARHQPPSPVVDD